MFCAGDPDGGKESCQGDYGGPIFTYANSDDAVTQFGVVSWGISCADARYPGVYFEIGAVRDWIDSKICRMSPDKPNSSSSNDDDSLEPPDGNKVVHLYHVDLLTDSSPYETSLELFDSAGSILEEIAESTYEI
mmetsp:Transcript_8370/g.10955  ORF Transcript_8370/g.10955 Transcript_8370/m.10955 type:complete len:134 (+) Transcript_8370:216-617(+)